MEQGGAGDGLFIISRGTVKVTAGDYVIDILGPGSMIGEMAVLTDGKRTATVTAETPVTALWMNSSGMQEVMKDSRELESRLWDTAGKRFAENMLGKSEPYIKWTNIHLRRWLSQGEVISSGQDEILNLDNRVGVLIYGQAFDKSHLAISAPVVLEKKEFTLSSGARVFVRSVEKM